MYKRRHILPKIDADEIRCIRAFLRNDYVSEDWLERKVMMQFDNIPELKQKYVKMLQSLWQALRILNINKYVLIKQKFSINVVTYDIDLLVPSPLSILRIASYFIEKGYNMVKGRLEFNPFKVMLYPPNSNDISIDIYPKVSWGTAFCYDEQLVIKNMNKEKIFNMYFNVPSVEDDLLIMSTHSYYSLKIFLPEILHLIIRVSETDKFNSEYILAVTLYYGLHYPVSLYVAIMISLISACLNEHTKNVIDELLHLLKMIIRKRPEVLSFLEEFNSEYCPLVFPIELRFMPSMSGVVHRSLRTRNFQYFIKDSIRLMLEKAAKIVY